MLSAWKQSRVEQVAQRGCLVCILGAFQDQASSVMLLWAGYSTGDLLMFSATCIWFYDFSAYTYQNRETVPYFEQRNRNFKENIKQKFFNISWFFPTFSFPPMSVIAWFWRLSFLKDKMFCWDIANHLYVGNCISPSTSCKIKGNVQDYVGSVWRQDFISKKCLCQVLSWQTSFSCPCFAKAHA